MEIVVHVIEKVWVGFQHGQLPDLGTWNYMLVAIFMMLQGRVSAVFSGIAVAAGQINLVPIIFIALAARLFVDLFWYNVGTTGRLDRLGRRFNAYSQLADRVNDGVREKPRRFILLAKLSNGLSVPAVITAGTAQIPYRKWLPASFIAELLWTLPLLFFGYFATGALSKVEGGLSYLTAAMTGAVLLTFILYLAKSWRRSRRSKA